MNVLTFTTGAEDDISNFSLPLMTGIKLHRLARLTQKTDLETLRSFFRGGKYIRRLTECDQKLDRRVGLRCGKIVEDVSLATMPPLQLWLIISHHDPAWSKELDLAAVVVSKLYLSEIFDLRIGLD